MKRRNRSGVNGPAAASQAVERRQRRGQRDLLLEDDVEERPEAGRPIPQRRDAEPRAIAARSASRLGQLGDGALERRQVERARQATVPRSPNPTDGSGSNARPSAPRSHARAFSPSDGRW